MAVPVPVMTPAFDFQGPVNNRMEGHRDLGIGIQPSWWNRSKFLGDH